MNVELLSQNSVLYSLLSSWLQVAEIKRLNVMDEKGQTVVSAAKVILSQEALH